MWFIIIIVVAVIFAIKDVRIHPKLFDVQGNKSEQAVAQVLDIDSKAKQSGKILTNIYVPKSTGDTSEIDVLYITRKGLIVVEDKDYSGYIFGSELNANWTETLYYKKKHYGIGRVEKYQFHNPIWQNYNHIKYLQEYLELDIKAFSVITFSNRGDLKNISISSPNVFVCNHSGLPVVLNRIWDNNPDIFTDLQIVELYSKLLPLTKVDMEVHQKHIEAIHDRFSNTSICPVCGKNLVLRTIKKGKNAGKQMYGCSNYPKCKYVKKL